MKYMRVYLCSRLCLWLSLCTLVVNLMSLQSAALDGVADAGGWGHAEIHLSATQLMEAQLTAFHPERHGATDHAGRVGMTQHLGQPKGESSQATPNLASLGARLRPIIVEALLNQRVSVPLVLDTGATYTVLTKNTAADLGITGLHRLPKQPFLTAGGKILSPVITLKSIRVGTAEAQYVEVAIDTEGHLPMGLLGMTFLRHFKITMDQEQGQVKFERR